MLTHTTDHAARALARLLEQLKPVRGLNAILNALNVQTQQVEDALWDLAVLRYLGTAEGEQLDVIGRILAEPREGFVDAQYRARLTAKIRVLRSSGSAADILKIYKLLLPDNVLKFTVMGGAGFILDVGVIDVGLLPIYRRFLYEAKSAGIYAHLLYTGTGSGFEGTFALSDNPDPLVEQIDSDKGLGDTADPDYGGTLSGVVVI